MLSLAATLSVAGIAYAKDVYGIPPENVIGVVGKSSYQIVDGVASIIKDPGTAR
jgi:hypothetical protein